MHTKYRYILYKVCKGLLYGPGVDKASYTNSEARMMLLNDCNKHCTTVAALSHPEQPERCHMQGMQDTTLPGSPHAGHML
jgi:hypothetical protein